MVVLVELVMVVSLQHFFILSKWVWSLSSCCHSSLLCCWSLPLFVLVFLVVVFLFLSLLFVPLLVFLLVRLLSVGILVALVFICWVFCCFISSSSILVDDLVLVLGSCGSGSVLVLLLLLLFVPIVLFGLRDCNPIL